MLEPSTIPGLGVTSLGTASAFEPYTHQVAGHAALCKFNDKTICKPLIPTERDFYELVARQGPLASFTADYLGVVNVTASASPRKSAPGSDGAVRRQQHQQHVSPASSHDGLPTATGKDDGASASGVVAAAAPGDAAEHGDDGDGGGGGGEDAGDDDEEEEEFGTDAQYTLTLEPFRIPQSPSALIPRRRGGSASNSSSSSSRRRRGDRAASSNPSSAGSSAPSSPSMLVLPTAASATAGASATALTASASSAGKHGRSGGAGHRGRTPGSPSLSLSSSSSSSLRVPSVPSSPRPAAVQANPWSLHCQRIDKLKNGQRRVNQFVLLEDLTYRFRKPCILDLKMGTRQHGPNATLDKIASQTAKCLATTSASLGVRVCGMQVFRADTGAFDYRDKYYGRSLTPETFKESIRTFLFNGRTVLTYLIPAFIARLTKLYQVVQSLPHLRFYGSSLLLIYDGKDDLDYLRDVDVRMIDFANTCRVEPATTAAPGTAVWAEADDGYLRGLRSLVKVLEELLASGPDPAPAVEPPAL